MHICGMHTCEMHALEMHTCEMHTREMLPTRFTPENCIIVKYIYCRYINCKMHLMSGFCDFDFVSLAFLNFHPLARPAALDGLQAYTARKLRWVQACTAQPVG